MSSYIHPVKNSQNTPTESKFENPCVRNCCLNDDNTCMGCGRELREILEWHQASDSRRAEIILSARNRVMLRQQA